MSFPLPLVAKPQSFIICVYPIVERYNRNFKYECLLVHLPGNLGELREVTTAYQYHYNFERPHQGKACHDLPPRVAFPELPRLPGLPEMVDPDSWLTSLNGEHFIRKVRSDGGVALDKYDYYLGRELAGQYVALVIDAAKGQIVVEHHQQEVKRLNLKGLYGTRLSMQAYSEAIKLEARSERRGWRPKATEAASGGAAASTSDLVSITQMEQMPLPMAEESGVSKA